MKVRKTVDAGYFLIKPRVIFHRAGAEWIHALVDRIIPRGDAREVPHDVDFSDFRHTHKIIFALKLARNNFVERDLINVERRQTESRTAWLRAFEDQLLVMADVSSYFAD